MSVAPSRVRRSLLGRWLLCAALAVPMSGCPESNAEPVEPEPDPEPLEPVVLVEGTTLGTETFEAGSTATGGQGEPVGGIGCIDQVDLHYHAHLSLFVDGERIAIPGAVGVVDAVFADGYVQSGGCYYWLHTHDATGLIHIEPPTADDYTLGDFFTVWGQSLTSSEVAGYSGTLSVFVDGERYDGDPAEIVLTSRKHVSLQIGRPLAPPPMYVFQG